MRSTLVFPDGVRLANRDELPGSEAERTNLWARIEAARIDPGYVLMRTQGERFACYAEANVDAPSIWPVFCDLSRALIGAEATLLFGEADDEPRTLGAGDVSTIIDVLSRSKYQLAHDGLLQFGVVSDDAAINEVFVAPTKHLKIWSSDEVRLKEIMQEHRVPEVSRLEFLDEYPRTTIRLPSTRGLVQDLPALALHLQADVAAKGRPN